MEEFYTPKRIDVSTTKLSDLIYLAEEGNCTYEGFRRIVKESLNYKSVLTLWLKAFQGIDAQIITVLPDMILIVGTKTKNDEQEYVSQVILKQGGIHIAEHVRNLREEK